ncbi:MAG: glycosyltransferase [Flavobacteriaceae bacterium]|nr:glycosyltransferase [Flavobacteriaceae bacterium]
MNIVLIGPHYPYRGGISDTNQELSKSLVRKGHKVELINFKLLYPKLLFPGKTQYEKNIKSDKSLKLLSSINPLSWLSTINYIRKQKPDLIITSYWTGFLSPCYFTLNSILNSKIKKIGIIHNCVSHEKKIFEKFFLKIYLSSLNKFFTLSRNVYQQIKNNFKVEGFNLFHPTPSKFGEKVSRNEALKKLNLDRNNKYILFFGLIRDYKGVDMLIKAMPALVKKNPTLKLLVVGENYVSNDKYLNLINDLKLSNHIILINKFIQTEMVKYWFSVPEYVILPYQSASQSGIIPLSYHFDLPVICSNINGLKESVKDGVNGFLFNRNKKNIFEKIHYGLNFDKSILIKNITKKKNKLSWDSFVEKLLTNI